MAEPQEAPKFLSREEAEELEVTGAASPSPTVPASQPPRIFEIENPREALREEMEDCKKRLAVLDLFEDRLLPIFTTAQRAIPRKLPTQIIVRPTLTNSYSWVPKEQHGQPRLRVQIDMREGTDWNDLIPLLDELESIGYDSTRWKSTDHPRDNCRQYDWISDDERFGICLNYYLKQVETPEEAAEVKCRRVMVGKKIHYGSTWEEEVYAFDCGQGAEATIREAIAKGALA